MSDEIILAIVVGALTLVGTVAGIIISHILERSRRNKELLFQARKETFSKIIAGLSSSFFLEGDDIVGALKNPIFKTRMRLRIGELFGPGRLLGSSYLSEKLRDLYDLEVEIWDVLDTDKDMTEINKKRADLALEVEALMREEMGIKD